MAASDREKWDVKHRRGDHTPAEPSGFLSSIADKLPTSGQALDLAGGTGRHAIWLARRGLDVTLVDISPVALAIAQRHSAAAGVSIRTLEADLEAGALPSGPWDLVLSSYFLHRPLLSELPGTLSPGGVLIVIQPTRTNLTRHAKPPAEYLLEDGELPTLMSGLEIEHHHEGWTPEGRYEAHLLARRVPR